MKTIPWLEVSTELLERFFTNLGIALFCGLLWSGVCMLALSGDFPTESPIFALYQIIKQYPLESFVCWHIITALCLTKRSSK